MKMDSVAALIAMAICTFGPRSVTAGWTLENPTDGSTFQENASVAANGLADSDTNVVYFGWLEPPEPGEPPVTIAHIEQSVAVTAGSPHPETGERPWTGTLVPNPTWNLSPLQMPGEPIRVADHACWVAGGGSYASADDSTENHVIEPMPE